MFILFLLELAHGIVVLRARVSINLHFVGQRETGFAELRPGNFSAFGDFGLFRHRRRSRHATSASDPMVARTARQVLCSPAVYRVPALGSVVADRVGTHCIERRLAVFVSIDRSRKPVLISDFA